MAFADDLAGAAKDHFGSFQWCKPASWQHDGHVQTSEWTMPANSIVTYIRGILINWFYNYNIQQVPLCFIQQISADTFHDEFHVPFVL